MKSVVLRPVVEGDRAFLKAVYASTPAQELAVLPWTDEEKVDFIAHGSRLRTPSIARTTQTPPST